MINNYFVFMPFSTFSWYTGNVFTFCSGTGNDALLFYQYIITTAYLANRKMLPFETTVFDECPKL